MSTPRCAAFALVFLLFGASSPLFGQESTAQVPSAVDRTNLEVQLNVIVASSESTVKATMPQALEPIVRQLRQTLPYTNYNLAVTYTNRVKGGARTESKGILASEMIFGQSLSGPPCFYEYSMTAVRLTVDGPNQAVEIPLFRFGFRLPIPIVMNRSEGTAAASFNYENAQVMTELSIREATPTLVGTMTTMKPNQLLVIVITVKRAP
jgi:hypothetical protein